MLNGLNESNDIEFGDVKTWLTMDSDEWSHLNKTAQNANELLQTLEENVGKGFDELSSKISEIGMNIFLKRYTPCFCSTYYSCQFITFFGEAG